MRRWIGIAVGVIIGLGAVAPFVSIASRASAAQDDAERGRQLFVKNGCYECHGYVGQGAAGTGPRLAPNPIPFELFSRIPYAPIDVMPRYSPQFVSMDDLRDMYAYLQSIPPSQSPDEIPLLRE